MAFPVMYGYKSWTIKKAEHWKIDAYNVVLEKTLVISLDCKEIQPVSPKENQSWIVSRRNNAEVEVPILWPPDAKSWLIKKDLDAGKDLKAGGEGDDRRWDCWMASLTIDRSLCKLVELVMDREAWHVSGPEVQRVRHDWATALTALKNDCFFGILCIV